MFPLPPGVGRQLVLFLGPIALCVKQRVHCKSAPISISKQARNVRLIEIKPQQRPHPTELTENVFVIVEVFGSVGTVHRHRHALLFHLFLQGVDSGLVVLHKQTGQFVLRGHSPKLTFLCSSNSWSAVSFSLRYCSSKVRRRFSISALRSTPCFSRSSICAKFQSTVSTGVVFFSRISLASSG
jgi:hypothetical protein